MTLRSWWEGHWHSVQSHQETPVYGEELWQRVVVFEVANPQAYSFVQSVKQINVARMYQRS